MNNDSVCLEATVLQGASSNAVLQGASYSAVLQCARLPVMERERERERETDRERERDRGSYVNVEILLQ